VRGLAAAVVATLAAAAWPALASGQAGVSYQIPPDNPFVGTPGALHEIYAYGMRNPFRWSFDRLTGDMYIGDVGGTQEEITYLPRASSAGANLGWNCWSGTADVTTTDCDPPNDVPPAYSYPSGDDVVIGGYVVRDPALPSFAGDYLYAQFDTGLYTLGPGASGSPQLADGDPVAVSSLGEDGLGGLYATSLAGPVYRIVEQSGDLDAQEIGSFDQPLAVVSPPGEATRLFVVEKPGRVMLRSGGSVTEFLDITGLVRDTGNEEGLLAFAVAPDYPTSGRVFAFYNDNSGDLQLDEFTRTAGAPDRSDAATRRPILTIWHGQASNHNGGQLLFGPDRYLYLSVGDGGPQGDPEGDAQNLGTALGKILRLDVGVAGPAGGGGGSGTDGDGDAAPTLAARVKRRQRVLRLDGAIAYVRCSEACSVAAGGRLRIGRARYRMRRVRGGTVEAGAAARAAQVTQRVRLKVRLTKRGRRALRRCARRGNLRRASVRVNLRATDGAGLRSPLVRRTVRVRR
jgi:glucose/arabinose dehydrogenase